MAIQIGERFPDVKLRTINDEGKREVMTDELFRGRRVVLFGVPGAFTGTCSLRHLPGFVDHADEIRARGVDLIACTAVNDIDVLIAWAREHGAGDKIVLLADGNGELAHALGLELDARPFGMGIRSQRYAAIVEDGVVKALHVDTPGEVTERPGAALRSLTPAFRSAAWRPSPSPGKRSSRRARRAGRRAARGRRPSRRAPTR